MCRKQCCCHFLINVHNSGERSRIYTFITLVNIYILLLAGDIAGLLLSPSFCVTHKGLLMLRNLSTKIRDVVKCRWEAGSCSLFSSCCPSSLSGIRIICLWLPTLMNTNWFATRDVFELRQTAQGCTRLINAMLQQNAAAETLLSLLAVWTGSFFYLLMHDFPSAIWCG